MSPSAADTAPDKSRGYRLEHAHGGHRFITLVLGVEFKRAGGKAPVPEKKKCSEQS